MTALADPVWFVRVHAARALGRLGHVDQASELLGLLGDPQWWVRTAAKESLQELGEDAAPAILPALKSDDKFVRDGAAEVLQNIGVVDELIRRLEQSPHDELALRTLRSIFEDGGRAVAGAALQRAVAPARRTRPSCSTASRSRADARLRLLGNARLPGVHAAAVRDVRADADLLGPRQRDPQPRDPRGGLRPRSAARGSRRR